MQDKKCRKEGMWLLPKIISCGGRHYIEITPTGKIFACKLSSKGGKGNRVKIPKKLLRKAIMMYSDQIANYARYRIRKVCYIGKSLKLSDPKTLPAPGPVIIYIPEYIFEGHPDGAADLQFSQVVGVIDRRGGVTVINQAMLGSVFGAGPGLCPLDSITLREYIRAVKTPGLKVDMTKVIRDCIVCPIVFRTDIFAFRSEIDDELQPGTKRERSNMK